MKHLGVIGICLLLLVMCKHKPEEDPGLPGGGGTVIVPPQNQLVCFNTQILPLITSNCANAPGCHSNVNYKDVILMSYSPIRKIAAEGELMKVLTTTKISKRMPYNRPPLTPDQIALVQKWINEGMKETICVDDCDTINVTFTKQVEPLMNNYCKGCHTGASAGGGVLLDSYATMKNQTINGKVICTVTAKGCNLMPKGGPALGFCNQRKLILWKEAGCPQ